MYKTVYKEKYGKLTVRERSYTLALNDEDYREADEIPVPIERIQPAKADARLSEFVRHYLDDHPETDLVDKLTKAASA